MPLIETAAHKEMRRELSRFAEDRDLDVSVPVLQALIGQAARIADGMLKRQAAETGPAWRTAAPPPPSAPRPKAEPCPAQLVTVEEMRDDTVSLTVLGLLAVMTNREIGERVCVSRDRVRYLIGRWYLATGMASREELAEWGRRQGLVVGGSNSAAGVS